MAVLRIISQTPHIKQVPHNSSGLWTTLWRMGTQLGTQASIIQCLSQARINWEGCGRKGIWRKKCACDGGGALTVWMGWCPGGLNFYRQGALPDAQPTMSKDWRKKTLHINWWIFQKVSSTVLNHFNINFRSFHSIQEHFKNNYNLRQKNPYSQYSAISGTDLCQHTETQIIIKQSDLQ